VAGSAGRMGRFLLTPSPRCFAFGEGGSGVSPGKMGSGALGALGLLLKHPCRLASANRASCRRDAEREVGGSLISLAETLVCGWSRFRALISSSVITPGTSDLSNSPKRFSMHHDEMAVGFYSGRAGQSLSEACSWLFMQTSTEQKKEKKSSFTVNVYFRMWPLPGDTCNWEAVHQELFLLDIFALKIKPFEVFCLCAASAKSLHHHSLA
jgi:hypothetical protein